MRKSLRRNADAVQTGGVARQVATPDLEVEEFDEADMEYNKEPVIMTRLQTFLMGLNPRNWGLATRIKYHEKKENGKVVTYRVSSADAINRELIARGSNKRVDSRRLPFFRIGRGFGFGLGGLALGGAVAAGVGAPQANKIQGLSVENEGLSNQVEVQTNRADSATAAAEEANKQNQGLQGQITEKDKTIQDQQGVIDDLQDQLNKENLPDPSIAWVEKDFAENNNVSSILEQTLRGKRNAWLNITGLASDEIKGENFSAYDKTTGQLTVVLEANSTDEDDTNTYYLQVTLNGVSQESTSDTIKNGVCAGNITVSNRKVFTPKTVNVNGEQRTFFVNVSENIFGVDTLIKGEVREGSMSGSARTFKLSFPGNRTFEAEDLLLDAYLQSVYGTSINNAGPEQQ